MPFTVSHTIAAVPLRRLLGRRAVTSALVIGTIVPDYRHFMPGYYRLPTHSPSALLWFALPFGVATYFLYHALLRAPALALLPLGVRRRLGRLLAPAPPSPLALVALCVVVGAVSHLAWDAFTHHHTLVVDAFPALFYKVVWQRGRYQLYAFDVFQHVSSLVGLALLVVWCRRWLARQPVDDTIGPGVTATERAVALLAVVFMPALALVAGFALARHAGWSLRQAAPLAVSFGGIVAAVGAVAYALAWRRRVPPPTV